MKYKYNNSSEMLKKKTNMKWGKMGNKAQLGDGDDMTKKNNDANWNEREWYE